VRKFPVIVVGLILSIGGSAAALPRGDEPVTIPGASRHELVHDGIPRTYRLYVPASLPRLPALVVVLHGGLGVGEGAARQGHWDEAAEEHGFIAVFPDGRFRSWNAGECCGPARANAVDDVGFVLAMLDAVHDTISFDRDRVYATGLSNGGMMAYRLACEASDRFAAIAPVGSALVIDDCDPSARVSVLHIHGLADRNVPFEGGDPTRTFQPNPPTYEPVHDGVDVFARADGCKRRTLSDTKGEVTIERWQRCRGDTDVQLITIEGGGHSWPGGDRLAEFLDPPSDALDATARIVRFFEAHAR
jgi:polyhydroxybutyrate depolymerase